MRCVAFYVTLINSGVNVQLLIECNQEQLCGNYTHAHDFFLEDGSDSDDLSDYLIINMDYLSSSFVNHFVLLN